MTPTARSLAFARSQGWHPAVAERRLPRIGTTVDLYGIVDLVVLDGAPGLVGVQATSGGNLAARTHKVSAASTARWWLAAGLRLECWGWSKRKVRRGGKAVRWTLRRLAARLDGDRVTWEEVPCATAS